MVEHWTRLDGLTWVRGAKSDGEVFKEGLLPGMPKGRPFELASGFVSLAQLR